MKHERARERARGDIGGSIKDAGLMGGKFEPETSKSLGGKSMEELGKGYCAEGSFKAASDPAAMNPGGNNKR